MEKALCCCRWCRVRLPVTDPVLRPGSPTAELKARYALPRGPGFLIGDSEIEAGHHFAARVNRHAKTHLRFASENLMSRLAADHQPLCFMRRQDRASHRSGSGRVATLLFPNTHRSSRSPSRCASCVAQSLGLKGPPLHGSVRVRSCVHHGCRRPRPFRALARSQTRVPACDRQRDQPKARVRSNVVPSCSMW